MKINQNISGLKSQPHLTFSEGLPYSLVPCWLQKQKIQKLIRNKTWMQTTLPFPDPEE